MNIFIEEYLAFRSFAADRVSRVWLESYPWLGYDHFRRSVNHWPFRPLDQRQIA
jgi:hypothetical protein